MVIVMLTYNKNTIFWLLQLLCLLPGEKYHKEWMVVVILTLWQNAPQRVDGCCHAYSLVKSITTSGRLLSYLLSGEKCHNEWMVVVMLTPW